MIWCTVRGSIPKAEVAPAAAVGTAGAAAGVAPAAAVGALSGAVSFAAGGRVCGSCRVVVLRRVVVAAPCRRVVPCRRAAPWGGGGSVAGFRCLAGPGPGILKSRNPESGRPWPSVRVDLRISGFGGFRISGFQDFRISVFDRPRP